MTTISESSRVASAHSNRVQYYAENLVRRQARCRYLGLADAIGGEPLVRLEGYGDGLTTVSVRESQLAWGHLCGVLGFRLAQFLQTGLMDPELVYRRELVHEPLVPATGPETIHTVTLTESGQIVGYIALVASPDPEPLALEDPARRPFPAEVAHQVELLSRYAAPGRTSHNAYEVKRFVRDHSLARGMQRDRVPWHLILAIGKVGLQTPEIELVLGDSSERGALRHLRLVGFELDVVEGTKPALPRSELMWPSYELPAHRLAKPFVGAVPSDLADYMEAIESGLVELDAEASQREAVARLVELHRSRGTLERLAMAV
ncbi:MAG TPA: hypothetical protein VG295_11615 [Solirubrobacteraceae bacterium]|nr:hypothetical protein [Solirubrobacteraceae bacterium]